MQGERVGRRLLLRALRREKAGSVQEALRSLVSPGDLGLSGRGDQPWSLPSSCAVSLAIIDQAISPCADGSMTTCFCPHM